VPGSDLYTDLHSGYNRLSWSYRHGRIDHAVEYVNGPIHVNGVENFWSLLKRGLKGTYVSVAPKHLFRYVDERAFTFNLRNLSDYGRFETALHLAAGRRLTFAELTAK
jgi:ISXO2-like transposase domain